MYSHRLLFKIKNPFNSFDGYYTDLLSVWKTIFDLPSIRHRWMYEIRLGRGAGEGGRTIYIGYNLFDYLGKSTVQYGVPCVWMRQYDYIHPRFVIRGWGRRAIPFGTKGIPFGQMARAILQVGCTAIVDDIPVVDQLDDIQLIRLVA